MIPLALVTGASSGIGEQLARYHARKGGDLIVTARREDQLIALKEELEASQNVSVHVIALDLGAEGGAQALIEEVAARGLKPGILINNAGFGGQGRHVERDLASELSMIDLNVKALVTLTHHFGRQMAEAGKGRILQVGSTAGFIPGPNQAVYFATKAFVNSFSQAVDAELRGKGVTCTVLAPGYVETEFAAAANLEGTALTRQKRLTAAQTARFGYDAMRRGELVAVSDWKLRLMLRYIAPFLPRRALLNMTMKMQAKN
ncbi:SDR family NAD(P)-dependent oxidoreductase [Pontivivens insulae]|uniref:Sulfoacetaldehyde reductase 2 n=1 Tax=Pontivivens insulae TaxID=1639689 RepID=A0A2R8ABU2_9RHOB|nr:SDR family oxidoreductase [Pontivivens insulae]RED11123.1 hypothetical protein DFR53_3153 [Pontivivens insulae]SPF29702.1 Sulfoacetaldehyde reductase 2 [Pontivivens insulae]